MIEAILNRYFRNDFNPSLRKEIISDTETYVLEKINYFKPEKGYKSYSYFQTVIKNYFHELRRRKVQAAKKRFVELDEVLEVSGEESESFSISDFIKAKIKKTNRERKKIIYKALLKFSENEVFISKVQLVNYIMKNTDVTRRELKILVGINAYGHQQAFAKFKTQFGYEEETEEVYEAYEQQKHKNRSTAVKRVKGKSKTLSKSNG